MLLDRKHKHSMGTIIFLTLTELQAEEDQKVPHRRQAAPLGRGAATNALPNGNPFASILSMSSCSFFSLSSILDWVRRSKVTNVITCAIDPHSCSVDGPRVLRYMTFHPIPARMLV